MAAPSVETESTTITLLRSEEWRGNQFSPVHHINGFPFRLRVCQNMWERKMSEFVYGALVCDKSTEAELWKCTTTVSCAGGDGPVEFVFCSWKNGARELSRDIGRAILPVGSSLQVTVAVEKNSWSSRLRPNLSSMNPNTVILVIGEEKKELRVNKQFLSLLSPYFDRLFFGNFKKKEMDKIPIGDVDYEEFCNIIKMVYGSSAAVLNDENMHRVLDLAARFELKVVEDKVISHLLSDSSSYSMAQKLLMSQERNLPFLKDLCLSECSDLLMFAQIKKAPEYADLSDATKVEILDEVLDLAGSGRNLEAEMMQAMMDQRFPPRVLHF